MRLPRRGFAALLGLGLVPLAVTGCAGLPLNTLSDGLVRADPVVEVRISGGSGSVTVIGDAADGVDVRRTVRYAGPRPGETMSVTDGVLSITTSCGSRCGASYEVHVGPGTTVTGDSGAGAISLRAVGAVSLTVGSGTVEVDGATGPVNVRAKSGTVDLRGITGAVTAHADSGTVLLSGVSGRVEAVADSGGIQATGLRGGPVSLRATSGRVEVALDEATNLTVEADSGSIVVQAPQRCCRLDVRGGSGHTDIQLREDPASPSVLVLRADSGVITVRPN